MYEQFETVKSRLDELSNELFMLTKQGVALDANFSKFGYSAHLRTKDDDDGTSSPGSTEEHLQDRSAQAMKFWKRPVMRQYFHKGLLWRSRQSGEAVTSGEYFIIKWRDSGSRVIGYPGSLHCHFSTTPLAHS